MEEMQARVWASAQPRGLEPARGLRCLEPLSGLGELTEASGYGKKPTPAARDEMGAAACAAAWA